ncbi:endopeptidase La [Anaerotignum propionicum]|uniref:Lon protease n=1 Tax=Anaerotignum propionicum DSM 1682 TaxID=991789 RepID=A0A0X8VDS5_ANAPI|nr:endopeptidase La [Anaerotignum propionicum]AMJ42144.1 Lon protease 1 [Anaerotignum propionicum DSM 1682]SHE52426.1 ATP-dependent Lon protease [[Clostridium] propionicum DSM 1682] [Anaerotignum propionicum DSM 1682]
MEKKETIKIPIIALRGLTVFPHMAISFPVNRTRSLDSVAEAEKNGGQVFLATQINPQTPNPEQEDLYTIGTLCVIKQVLKLPGNMTHVIVEGKERGRLESIWTKTSSDYAEITLLEQDLPEEPDDYLKAYMRVAIQNYEEYTKYVPNSTATDLLSSVEAASKPGKLADLIAAGLEISYERKQRILEMLNPMERLEAVLEIMQNEKDILTIKKEIESKTKTRIEQNQREYYLREEMKVIQEELGDKDGIGADAEKYRKQLEKKNPPEIVRTAIEKEITRMLRIPVTSPESNVSRNYIETLLSLPWIETTQESFDLAEAEQILNEDHYGLEKVKERILEYLAVRKNVPEERPTILCLVGPPGIGKTSIARSVARALDRKYIRMSLGGVKDEAEIRGHRKTYIGAMPGRIINAMKQAGTINPLMLLDEIDKLGVSHNGDPAAALLEVLDGEQNSTFRDHFIELPYDLSKVLFMCTANSLDTIPKPLLDRMEVISLGSYTSQEKLHIAKEHFIEKQCKRNGLSAGQIKFKDDALEQIIDGYTREAGVRQLERVIGEICRKTVKKILSGEVKSVTVSGKTLESILGKRKYGKDTIYVKPQVGIVRGLAWTSVGGTTLSIEVNAMEGDGKFKLTGNVGKVMMESAEAAISYIRSQAKIFGLEPDFYKRNDIHIHIPEGATPKDGPSAGITMATAILSALIKEEVHHDVAMTGEVTIRGRVLPIGGLQEKVLAAKKVGIKTVILPWENDKDLTEINDEIKDGIEFVLAKTMEDVLKVALVKGVKIWK